MKLKGNGPLNERIEIRRLWRRPHFEKLIVECVISPRVIFLTMQQRPVTRNAASSTSSEDSNHHHHLGPAETTLSCLWILTPLAATLSVLVILVAVFTNHWMHTEEKMSNPSYNGTGEKDYLSKMTVSGLWTLCFTQGESIFFSECFCVSCTEISES